jgi:hypothetical protein
LKGRHIKSHQATPSTGSSKGRRHIKRTSSPTLKKTRKVHQTPLRHSLGGAARGGGAVPVRCSWGGRAAPRGVCAPPGGSKGAARAGVCVCARRRVAGRWRRRKARLRLCEQVRLHGHGHTATHIPPLCLPMSPTPAQSHSHGRKAAAALRRCLSNWNGAAYPSRCSNCQFSELFITKSWCGAAFFAPVPALRGPPGACRARLLGKC